MAGQNAGRQAELADTIEHAAQFAIDRTCCL
jgi:hypothetical protein